MNWRYAFLLLVLNVSCYPAAGAAPGPVSPAASLAAAQRWPDATPESLENGRQLFLAKCNNCHGYPIIEKVATEEWPSIVKRMGQKAHLSAPDQDLVLRFVLTEREHSATSGAQVEAGAAHEQN